LAHSRIQAAVPKLSLNDPSVTALRALAVAELFLIDWASIKPSSGGMLILVKHQCAEESVDENKNSRKEARFGRIVGWMKQ
jgi:hypothetical protein